ncbi:hypothetical protein J2Z66_001375 [Paenibacillus eucommiae]|uniref:Uncharacterized protein n=1 Tax=Paenibacillus eucommiae TaxID=1355755 RepID=A0ABS4IQD5_9BACL|nr:hypothetical protein [Paenibacillus eucommiae]
MEKKWLAYRIYHEPFGTTYQYDCENLEGFIFEIEAHIGLLPHL